MADDQKQPSYRDTLNLPTTDFPIRPNPKIDDPALIERWEAARLYADASRLNADKKSYILHDGPPYANGHIHLGHAYNKILKDIITKAYRMSGYHVPVTPGWDCHGLPIEQKVTQEKPGLSPVELTKACRAYAQDWIKVQREEFKRLGVVMDWDNPYVTMAPAYEAKIMEAFGVFVAKGFVERKNKTITWCASCETVLATAEIEYQDRKDPSLYVLFPLAVCHPELGSGSQRPFPEVSEPISLLVWTTTPWTLPLNRAVALKPGAEYVLARLKNQLVVIGAETLARVEKLVGETAAVLERFPAEKLAGMQVSHPFDDRTVPILLEEFVGLDDGTACVHMAPGCGPIDYEAGVKNNLEIFSPISPAGRYTSGIMPRELEGMLVTDGQIWVIKDLARRGLLFHKTTITHSYPHCWRCRNGLIFRATKQWFINLDHNDMKERALKAIDGITFIPPQGKNFLRATIENRWEWCISRQRVWGVPIPALICQTCDAVYCTPEFINSVAGHVANEGIEYWGRVKIEELMAVAHLDFARCERPPLCCTTCGSTKLRKEHDILDVWFDSGVSHYAVLNQKEAFPADMYLEGVDQHRGWFQSSLLTALVLAGGAPMKSIMVHGFTVDEKGQKMSKSLGNVVAPQEIIDQLGTDGLRLWVASIGHEGDAVVSDTLLRNVGEVFRKVRNTCRFLLSNMYDFNTTTDLVAPEKLRMIDRAILAELVAFNRDMQAAYKSGELTKVFHGFAEFCAVDLSAWYLDIVKDRLYVERADGHARRSAQTACWYLLDTLTRLSAPILSFTAEQLSDLYQKNKTVSIHLQHFADITELEACYEAVPGYSSVEWELLREMRSAVLKALEAQREQGVIKHSLEARVTLFVDPGMKGYELYERFVRSLGEQSVADFWREFCIVSQVELASSAASLPALSRAGMFAIAEHARGGKCPRCWNWDALISDGLCRRCRDIVK